MWLHRESAGANTALAESQFGHRADDEHPLLADVDGVRSRIVWTLVRFVLSSIQRKAVRKTAHYREWYYLPMSYSRILELPLTHLALDAQKKHSILDIGSPKLLAFYYWMSGFNGVVASDMDGSFVSDFKTFSEHVRRPIATGVFDVTKGIPFPDGSVDRIFSVSVLEHIPWQGDQMAMANITRALKPGGIAVMSVPACQSYMEEWVKTKEFSWPSVQDGQGRFFYQRRYDEQAVFERLAVGDRDTLDMVLIAERPIRQPAKDANGMLRHNAHYVQQTPMYRICANLARLRIPLVLYGADVCASQRLHYLTRDWSDKNIRQVVIRIRKGTV